MGLHSPDITIKPAGGVDITLEVRLLTVMAGFRSLEGSNEMQKHSRNDTVQHERILEWGDLLQRKAPTFGGRWLEGNLASSRSAKAHRSDLLPNRTVFDVCRSRQSSLMNGCQWLPI